MIYDVVILGSGPAGLTAGIYAQRFGLKTLLVAGRKWGGQLIFTTDVENFPGFAKIQGPELMQKMRDHVKELGVEIMDLDFTRLDALRQAQDKPFLVTAEDKTFESKSVIVATGADTRWLGLPNEERLRGKGLSSCAPCDAFFFRGKTVAVGGGDSAMEEAQVISKVSPDVILIHRKDEFRAQAAMIEKVRSYKHVRFLYNTKVVDVLGDPTLTGMLLETESISPKQGVKDLDELISQFGGKKTSGNQWELPRQGVFVAIGLIPNTDKFQGIELDKKGYVKRYEEKDENGMLKYFTKTSVPGIFTSGDVHDTRYKQAITASAFGCMAAMDVQRWLEDKSW
jgi:thioredoxin reductase (NADPH)